MVDIGGTTYIFRECDENIGKLKVYEHTGYIGFYVYNENNEMVINQYAFGDSNYTIVSDGKQEMLIQEFENTAIENGAVLYKGLTK